jgi:hypothetical protein
MASAMRAAVVFRAWAKWRRPSEPGVEIIMQKLIGGQMSTCGIVKFVETVEVLDLDYWRFPTEAVEVDP